VTTVQMKKELFIAKVYWLIFFL